MNSKSRKHAGGDSFTTIGTSSLLIIFVILTMVVLAVLSVSTARRDYRAASLLAEHRTGYTKACAAAEEIAADIDGILAGASARNDDKAGFLQDLRDYSYSSQEFTDGATVTLTIGTDANDTTIISYTVPAGDDQALFAELELTSTGDHYYNIRSWETISTAEWTSDDTLDLYIPE